MKSNEFIPEEQLEELATESHRTKLNRLFKANGFKKIGAGADAMVFSKDTTTVTKIMFPSYINRKAFEGAEFVLLSFVKFCEQNPSPFLPRIEHVGTINVDGESFHQIIIERLQKIKSNSLAEMLIWNMSEYAARGLTWKEAYIDMCDPIAWRFYDIDDPRVIANKVKQMTPAQQQQYDKLYDVIVKAYKFGKARNLGWDLHTENVMQRADGTIVITDPWTT